MSGFAENDYTDLNTIDKKEVCSDLTSKNASDVLVINTINCVNFDQLSKAELIQLVKESQLRCIKEEKSKEELQSSIAKLEKTLNEQYERCKNLEEDKSFLRNNIKKASANWFERKAKLSEGENDQTYEDGRESENETDDKPKKQNGAHILITEEAVKLFSELKYKDEQLELSDRRCVELSKRLKDYEQVIDDQEVVIHGLENQLDTYFSDNQKMSKQLADLHKLFVELETINEKQVNIPEPVNETESASEHLPSEKEFKDMAGSVSKTYLKLKELIYEKKSLVTEIERLQTLNVELQHRVSQQETRLMSVSDALQTTWLLVSNLKEEHAKIHTAESILRYELRGKREILHRLRAELECSREQWHIIRQKNSETEQEWLNLRNELNERRKLAEMRGDNSITPEEIEGAVGGTKVIENEFEPPIDLLVDMGIEYGVVNADDEEPMTAVALIGGEDVHEDRLQNLEEQCCHLYQKLMTSTARALNLASRLTTLHQPYAMSDEEGEEEEDDEEEGEYMDENDEDEDVNIYESEVLSPDSDSYDTAYVSEADGADSASASGVPITPNAINENVNLLNEEIQRDDSPDLADDCGDYLSKRLINILPKKIEILKTENKKLEERLTLQQEEKTKMESTLTATIEFERRHRKQLEEQFSHLGKLVDELKLERNGKIAAVEEELRKKVEEVRKEEKEHIQLKNEFESLKEKFDQREELIRLSALQMENADQRIFLAEQALERSKGELESLQEQMENFKNNLIENRMEKVSIASQSCQTDMDASHLDQLPGLDSLTANEEKDLKARVNSYFHHRVSNASPKFNQLSADPPERILGFARQLKRIVILAQSILRLPFNLLPGSVLCWTSQVFPEEIVFSITFDELNQTIIDAIDESDYLMEPSSSTGLLDTLNGSVHVSRELIKPRKIISSSNLTKGRILPKIAGQYCLVFHNLLSKDQEILLTAWLEEASG